jgi:hypothetical protein
MISPRISLTSGAYYAHILRMTLVKKRHYCKHTHARAHTHGSCAHSSEAAPVKEHSFNTRACFLSLDPTHLTLACQRAQRASVLRRTKRKTAPGRKSWQGNTRSGRKSTRKYPAQVNKSFPEPVSQRLRNSGAAVTLAAEGGSVHQREWGGSERMRKGEKEGGREEAGKECGRRETRALTGRLNSPVLSKPSTSAPI